MKTRQVRRWPGLALGALSLGVLAGWLNQAPVANAACSGLPSDKGRATYTVSIPATATYRVWARLYPAAAGQNGIYMQIDGTHCNVVLGHHSSIPAGQLTWVDYGNAPASKVNLSLGAGSRQVTLAGYDSNVGVDKILFLSDSGCTPSGDGSNCMTTASAGAGGTPTATPLPVGTSSQPVAVSGMVRLTTPDVPAGSKVVYKLDGKVVPSGNIDTTKLSDGIHILEEIITTPDGKTTTKRQVIKVENGWQYQLMRAVRAHPYMSVAVLLTAVLAGLGSFMLLGPPQYGARLWRRFFGRPAVTPAIAPKAPMAPPVAPQVVYPDTAAPADSNPKE